MWPWSAADVESLRSQVRRGEAAVCPVDGCTVRQVEEGEGRVRLRCFRCGDSISLPVGR
jgi:hypothetical protein